MVQHSRRIHLLLAEESDDARVMAATLKPYRPDMNVIHIGSHLEIGLIVMEVSKALDSSNHVNEDQESSRGNERAELTAKVDEARSHFLESSRNFLKFTNDVPSGLSHPDGVTRIQRRHTNGGERLMST